VEHPQRATLEVGNPPDGVDDACASAARVERERERVHREVPPREIVFQASRLHPRKSARMRIHLPASGRDVHGDLGGRDPNGPEAVVDLDTRTAGRGPARQSLGVEPALRLEEQVDIADGTIQQQVANRPAHQVERCAPLARTPSQRSHQRRRLRRERAQHLLGRPAQRRPRPRGWRSSTVLRSRARLTWV